MQCRDVALSSPAAELGDVSQEFIPVLDFYLFSVPFCMLPDLF